MNGSELKSSYNTTALLTTDTNVTGVTVATAAPEPEPEEHQVTIVC